MIISFYFFVSGEQKSQTLNVEIISHMSTGETIFTLTQESSQLLEENIPMQSKK